MASVDDIDELIATRRLNGVDDGLYESDKNVANMTEEAFNEIIDNFEVVTYLTEYGRRGIKENVKRLQKENEEKDKYIKHSEEITTEMNKDINKLLLEIKQKDKQIDLMGEVIFEKFKAQLVIEYGIENKEQFVKLFKEKAKEKGE